MRKVFVSHLYLIGLCAYLRRLEMSVDRSLREEIKPLKDYCEGSSMPTLRQVLDRLSLIGAGEMIQNSPQDESLAFPRELYSILIARIQWYSRGGIIMKEGEVQFIYSTLLKLSVALDQCQIVDPDIFVPIRVRLYVAGDFRLRCIPERIRKKIYGVEHLNQNPMLKTETVESICNDPNWLASKIEIIS